RGRLRLSSRDRAPARDRRLPPEARRRDRAGHRALRRGGRQGEMTRGAGALVLFLLALAPGCASAPDRLKDLHSADQGDRIDAAIALSNAVVAGDSAYVGRKREISTELRR